VTALLLDEATLLDPEAQEPSPGALLLEGGRIRARLAPGETGPPDARRVALPGRALAPGFLDVHHHGRLVFTAPERAGAVLGESAAALLAEGTTAFLPTTVAWPRDALLERVEVWAAAIAGLPEGAGAAPLGLHLEGPWIRGEAAGAQPREGIRPFTAAEGEEVRARAAGTLRMVTLAPEVEGAAALLAWLAREGVVAAIGHSRADDASMTQAVQAGARHVTHLFNAMSGLHHRERGVAGHALAEDRLTCDLICDGVHVHPDVVRVAARAKGEGWLLITDRVEPAGGEGGEPGFGSGRVHGDGTALRLSDGTLAGSSLTMDRALRNARAFTGAPLLEAVAACTLRPARLLGLEAERGTLRPGARADLVVLDAAGRVEQTWLGGAPAWIADPRAAGGA